MFFKNKVKEQTFNNTVAVWSPHSGGATTIASCFCEYLIKNTHSYITLIDADIYKPSVDLYMGFNVTPIGIYDRRGQGSLNLISDALIKNIFTNEVYHEITVKYGDRCTVITGNTSLSDCENIWNGDKNSSYFKGTGKDSFVYYGNILKKAQDTSNITLVDLSSSIFMDSTKYYLHYTDKVIVVINPNYPQVMSAKALLEHCKENFSLTKDKVLILINKYSKESLEFTKIRELLKEWTLVKNYIDSDADCFDRAANKENVQKCMEKYKSTYHELSSVLGFIEEETLTEKAINKLRIRRG